MVVYRCWIKFDEEKGSQEVQIYDNLYSRGVNIVRTREGDVVDIRPNRDFIVKGSGCVTIRREDFDALCNAGQLYSDAKKHNSPRKAVALKVVSPVTKAVLDKIDKQ